ncbi:MAG: arginine decarboxylase, pyruvoyl-dependent [Candidatus Hodarchaeaceae archaeon]|nr:arginine decarboxylase, pyruvoyl-dependent [Candidatus Hodarchaeaceae archaeon]
MNLVPRYLFFTRGVGHHRERLRSFEYALENAGIAKYNLVSVSSIIPPGCKLISREEGLRHLRDGQIIFGVFARCDSNERRRLISASIGCALPADENTYGYVSEHHAYGQTAEEAGEYAEDLAASMLASALGLPFDPDKSWHEREQIWKISKKIVRTMNVTQTAFVKENMWSTVFAAAVFVLGE